MHHGMFRGVSHEPRLRLGARAEGFEHGAGKPFHGGLAFRPRLENARRAPPGLDGVVLGALPLAHRDVVDRVPLDVE